MVEQAALVLIGFSWIAAAVLLAAGVSMPASLAQSRFARMFVAILIGRGDLVKQ